MKKLRLCLFHMKLASWHFDRMSEHMDDILQQDNKITKLIKFILSTFPYGVLIFRPGYFKEAYKNRIYDQDGITVDYLPDYKLVIINGLTELEYEFLKTYCHGSIVLKNYRISKSY